MSAINKVGTVANSGLVAPIVGHVGHGNFLALILFKTDEEKMKVQGTGLHTTLQNGEMRYCFGWDL
jgi:hypothetical protein